MTTDYFEAKKTGGSKDSIEITVYVKTEKVVDFVNEIRNTTIDEVLKIIYTAQPRVDGRVDVAAELTNRMLDRQAVRDAVLALKGEQG